MVTIERKYFALNSTREVSREVFKRQQMERMICSTFVRSCLKAGYTLSVHDGDAWAITRSNNYKAVMAALFSVDEERIYVYDANGTRLGGVFCVYGNDGWDVFADWHTKLDDLGLMKKAMEVSDRLQGC